MDHPIYDYESLISHFSVLPQFFYFYLHGRLVVLMVWKLYAKFIKIVKSYQM